MSDYIQKGSRPGRLIIFNHTEFNVNIDNSGITEKQIQCRNAVNPAYDENDLRSLCESFRKCSINDPIIFENLTKMEIRLKMTEVAATLFYEESCLIIVILSRGLSETDILTYCSKSDIDNEIYNIDSDILGPLRASESLSKLPIFVFAQIIITPQLTYTKTTGPNNLNKYIPTTLFKYYSSSNGYVKHNVREGSLYIQCFCELFNEIGIKSDITSIMKLLEAKVFKLNKDVKCTIIQTSCAKSLNLGDTRNPPVRRFNNNPTRF